MAGIVTASPRLSSRLVGCASKLLAGMVCPRRLLARVILAMAGCTAQIEAPPAIETVPIHMAASDQAPGWMAMRVSERS